MKQIPSSKPILILKCFLTIALVAVSLPLHGHPRHGGAHAHEAGPTQPVQKLVVVQFARFDCPESAEVSSQLKQLLTNDRFALQVIFKHFPNGPEGLQTHEAVEAAGKQGRFWAMHDRLFEQPKASYTELLQIAKSISLDVKWFQTDLDERTFRQQVLKDVAEARGLGVSRTPTLFVNGRKLEGIAQVRSFVNGLIHPSPSEPDPEKRYEFDLSVSPSRGPKDAPITIVEFSDFRCGFCGPNSRNLSKIEQAFPGKVRRVFKHFPIKQDDHGRLPHLGAVAAEKQGKFWEMRKALMGEPLTDLTDLLARAQSIGLDMKRFQEDLHQGEESLDRDLEVGYAIGIRRTPTTFVNGKAFSGRQTFRTLQHELNGILGLKPSEDSMPILAMPTQGPADADVLIEFYCDYSRPENRRLSDTLSAFLKGRNNVRVEFRPYTLGEQQSVQTVNAIALATASQGKFNQWHQGAMASGEPVTQRNVRGLLERIAVDLDQVSDDLADGIHRPLLDVNGEEARTLGLKGESALVMNGTRLAGVPELSDLLSQVGEGCCGVTFPSKDAPAAVPNQVFQSNHQNQ